MLVSKHNINLDLLHDQNPRIQAFEIDITLPPCIGVIPYTVIRGEGGHVDLAAV